MHFLFMNDKFKLCSVCFPLQPLKCYCLYLIKSLLFSISVHNCYLGSNQHECPPFIVKCGTYLNNSFGILVPFGGWVPGSWTLNCILRHVCIALGVSLRAHLDSFSFERGYANSAGICMYSSDRIFKRGSFESESLDVGVFLGENPFFEKPCKPFF